MYKLVFAFLFFIYLSTIHVLRKNWLARRIIQIYDGCSKWICCLFAFDSLFIRRGLMFEKKFEWQEVLVQI